MRDPELLSLDELELEDALFGRSKVRTAPIIFPRDTPAMREALEAMDRAGRESKAWREKVGALG